MSAETRVIILSLLALIGCDGKEKPAAPSAPYWKVTYWPPHVNGGKETFLCKERPNVFSHVVKLRLTDGREVMLIGSVVMEEQTK